MLCNIWERFCATLTRCETPSCLTLDCDEQVTSLLHLNLDVQPECQTLFLLEDLD